MPVPRKIFTGTVARSRYFFVQDTHNLKRALDKEGKLDTATGQRFQRTLRLMDLKASVGRGSVTPARVKRGLDALVREFERAYSLRRKAFHIIDLQKPNPGESRKQWLERRRRTWRGVLRRERELKKVHSRIQHFMEHQPQRLLELHDEIQEKMLRDEQRTLSALEKLGFKFDKKTNTFEASVVPFTRKTIEEYGFGRALNAYAESVKRTNKAYSVLYRGLEKFVHNMEKLSLLYESLEFESAHYPQTPSPVFREIQREIERRTKTSNFLWEVEDVFRREIMPRIGRN